jgi:acyl-CoA synthetase (AMP-forming)/AMP-acid ligase II
MPRIGYFDGVSPFNNCTSMFFEHLRNKPKKTAIRWAPSAAVQQWLAAPTSELEHSDFTFEQIFGMAGKIAWGLRNLGVKENDRVILFVPMTPFLYSTLFALQMLGAIPVFLDTWARRQQLGVVAKIVDAKGMISVEQAFAHCEGEPQIDALPLKICLGPATRSYTARIEELVAQPNFITEPVAVEREHTALITFTTGSSGTPKGANRTHRFLTAQHYALDECIPYTDSDIDLPVFPIFSLNNLAAGVTTVLPAIDVANAAAHDAQLLVHQILSRGVTCLTTNPSLLIGISKYCSEKGIVLSNLRRCVVGGAAVSRDSVIDFVKIAPNCDLMVTYGSTEVEPIAHISSNEIVKMPSATERDPELVDDGVIVGHFANGLEFKFIRATKDPVVVRSAADWKGVELPAGQTGELIVAGEHVCRDYYNDEVAFSRAKIRDERGVVWHRTGDMGRLDASGNVWLVGRVHNTIMRGGEPCFPVKAEIVLKRLEFVRTAAYLGIPDAKLGEATWCVVAPRDEALLKNEGEMERHRREILRLMAKNAIPVDRILFRREIPLDPRHRSKVEYEVLRSELQAEKLF